MELYGRPLVARRNTTPNVLFLNEPKPRPSPATPALPSARGHDANTVANLHVVGGATGTNTAPASVTSAVPSDGGALFHHTHSRPPPSARPIPIERPQSSGVRRPAPGAPLAVAPSSQLKQRPSTARESSRTNRHDGSVFSSSCDSESLFTTTTTTTKPPATRRSWLSTDQKKNNHDGPEQDDESDDQATDDQRRDEPGRAKVTPDELYIQQLKADILYCHHLLASERGASVAGGLRAHTHVKNVQNMRETRSSESSSDALSAQLKRYNYARDATQLQSSKTKLETILSEYVTQLMRHFLELRDEFVDAEATDKDTQHESSTSTGSGVCIELLRAPGATLPFANGCGTDAASLYAGGLVGVLQSVERFRTVIMSLHGQRSVLQKTVEDKNRQVSKLHEQVELFKDALAKAMAKRSSNTEDTSRHRLRSARPTVLDMSDFSTSRGLEVLEMEHAAQLNAMEKERKRLEETIANLQADKETLAHELHETRNELEQHKHAAEMSRVALDHALEHAKRDATEKATARERRERELQTALSAMTDKCRLVEETASKDKQVLRNDNTELTVRIRKLEEELRAKSTQLNQKTDATATALQRANDRVELLTAQLRATDQKLAVATQVAESLRGERDRETFTLAQTRSELATASARVAELTEQLQQTSAAHVAQLTLLRQAELKCTQAQAETQRQVTKVHHLTNQLELLEQQLRRSVSVDEDERKRRQQDEQTAWHQQLSALEHLLAVERQTVQSQAVQHHAALAQEREKATHTAAQNKTLAIELEAANLCLAERKRQRDRETSDFESHKTQLLDRIALLSRELEHGKTTLVQCQQQLHRATEEIQVTKQEMEKKYEQLRCDNECKQNEREIQTQRLQAAAENALAAEVAIRSQLQVVEQERDVLAHRLQGGVGAGEKGGTATPRSSVGGAPGSSSSALSETRVELQKAKLKIAALEEKLTKSDSARGKDVDAKLAQLAQRERRLVDDQKIQKKHKLELTADKKQLKLERELLDQQRMKAQEDSALLQQIIRALASRLALQMELLRILPRHVTDDTSRETTSLSQFVVNYQRDHGDAWRSMQLQWEHLQQELDDADWQLVHMRNRLQELDLDGFAMASASGSSSSTSRPATPAMRGKPPILSAFSDAVAAGRDTLPIAEKLQTSASKAAIIVAPSVQEHEREKEKDSVALAARVRQEEQETFAIAMAKEMRAMKESYEAKMDELTQELRTAQKLRVESTQRLRSELDDEKKRSQQIIAQLTDKCAVLETQLLALQRAFSLLQDQQIELLQQIENATGDGDAARTQALHALYSATREIWREERSRRETREQDRVRKLLDYCGSSSVSVERDDKTRLL